MEARVQKLEDGFAEMRVRFATIVATLSHLATQEDIASIKDDLNGKISNLDG